MNVQEATVTASRKSTAMIVLREYGPLDGRRYDAGLAADAQRLALLIFGKH